MRFKNWLQIQEGTSGSGGGTAADLPPEQDKLAMMTRNKGKGGGAFPSYSNREDPPPPKNPSPLKKYLPTLFQPTLISTHSASSQRNK